MNADAIMGIIIGLIIGVNLGMTETAVYIHWHK